MLNFDVVECVMRYSFKRCYDTSSICGWNTNMALTIANFHLSNLKASYSWCSIKGPGSHVKGRSRVGQILKIPFIFLKVALIRFDTLKQHKP